MQRLSVDRQGRVTIPGRLRRQLGIAPGMELMAEPRSGGLLLRPSVGEMAGQETADSDFYPLTDVASGETVLRGTGSDAPDGEAGRESVISGATLRADDRRKIIGLLAV
jgi:AbrB family looped-hinge helix DNA binding protein